ncbi:PREDICTED: uncharacterized protein LOC104600320 [Nelumbo nucifera]|uniref:Uncharacterized protein LOC104600320 n=1 Tax=Nelumbo nucifera TaxID=4432 RepID=A0A1U8A370_NELNU|nr:PREDICTED: uncharacterized protein LOC104600320 [Nelumbo nucifera]
MAEGTKVRVVRCPRCENLLPELPDYSVYQCGGCGAVLRAKVQASAIDESSNKSVEERTRSGCGSEKLEISSEKGGANLSDASETDRESNGLECRRSREKPLSSPEKVFVSNSASSSRPQSREGMSSDHNGGRGVEPTPSRYNNVSTEKESGYGGGSRYRNPSKAPADYWVDGKNQIIDANRDEFDKSHMEKGIREVKPRTVTNGNGSLGLEHSPDWRRGGERDGQPASRRPPRTVTVEGLRYSNFPYPDEGPSNYHLGSSHGYAEPSVKNQNKPTGSNKVEYLEQDRAELLRKLDELKDQLSRSCDVAEKSNDRIAMDRRMVHPEPYGGRDPWFPEGLAGSSSRSSVQAFPPDKRLPRPSFFSNGHESVQLMNRPDMDLQNFYPPMHVANDIPGYGDPFGPPMLRRNPHQPPRQYTQRPSHDFFSGHYMDIESDPIASYPQNTFFHQPACSCLQCYNKHWQMPAHFPPPVFQNRRIPDAGIDPMFNRLETPAPFPPRNCAAPRGGANTASLHSREPQSRARRQVDLDSEMDGFGRARSGRVVVANATGRRCLPIDGGAPFITCCSCFALLQLPRKLSLIQKNQQKLRCGACSTVMLLSVESKRLVVSFPVQAMQTSPDQAEDGSEEMVKGLSHSHTYVNRDSINSSEDFDNSGYNFQCMDSEQGLSSKDQKWNLGESQKMQGHLSSSFSSSENEESPDSVIARRQVSKSGEQPLKATVTPPLPGSPLHEHSTYGQGTNRFGKGNLSKRSEQEKVVSNKGTFRQDSIKDASAATEMDVSFNEYSNTGMSQDSGEVSREDVPRVSKAGDSFFAGLIKKSFRDFTRSNHTVENERCIVSVNGQPIPDRLVKKAEKKAGPIHPGQYWYDSQGGFWGVMGQPCLGIIPPFIEEFNYPMPKNCAGGNTRIFVNGRELHQKDLDLLSSRGLPDTADKSYIIEISGRVMDADSGEELESLGKLAPTVERVKHGFGMRVPKVAM